jgi:hypothetical protein
MAENLNYNTNESMCYDNKVKNCDKYGKLYNWETAMKACPMGWHLPRNEEWNILINYVGNTDKLKEINSWSLTYTWYSYLKKTDLIPPFLIINFLSVSSDNNAVNFFVLSGLELALYSVYYFMYSSTSPYVNAKFSGIDNNYGFSALPGGYVDVESNTKKSVEIKKYGGWWTATEVDSSYAYYRSLYYDMYNVIEHNYYKSFLFSVRCVLD